MPDNNLTEIKQKLDGILGIVQKKKEESRAAGTSWGWVTAALAAVLAFIGLAFAAYDAWKKGREIAKLKHEKDLAEETKQKVIAEEKITKEYTKQKSQQILISSLETKIAAINTKIGNAEQQRQNIHSKIDQVTSWADFDDLLK